MFSVIITLILRPDQGDQQGGGGGGGQEGDPLVGGHHQAPRGQVAGARRAGVVHPPPGEDHGAQPVHTALQPVNSAQVTSIIQSARVKYLLH